MTRASTLTISKERRSRDRNGAGKRRYFDPKYGAMAVKVLPGDYYVSDDPSEMIVTILGSCVAACVRDRLTGIGGLNHFMLPDGDAADWSSANAVLRYGSDAMETLLNDLYKRGAPRSRLEVKVFGGANVIGSVSEVGVGHKNAAFVSHYLKNEGIPIEASDLGGNFARRIHYFPETGKVNRLLLRRRDDSQVFQQESSIRRTIKAKEEAVGGDIELFD